MNVFTVAICNGVIVGEIELVISLLHMHPKLKDSYSAHDGTFEFSESDF